MTEHAGSVFVSFFLGEYASIVLICIVMVVLFLGGYLISIKSFLKIIKFMATKTTSTIEVINYKISKKFYYKNFLIDPIIDGLYSCFSLGLKSIVLIFVFI
jgi:NADH-ubiquinone oxidoreductase chain 1